MALRTDYKNDILNPSMNGKRQFKLIDAQDGTTVIHPCVNLQDVTSYAQRGDDFGKDDINAMNAMANKNYADNQAILPKVSNLDSYLSETKNYRDLARTSEENALAYKNSASSSEANAKKYMDIAFNTTPDGYQAFVENTNEIIPSIVNGSNNLLNCNSFLVSDANVSVKITKEMFPSNGRYVFGFTLYSESAGTVSYSYGSGWSMTTKIVSFATGVKETRIKENIDVTDSFENITYTFIKDVSTYEVKKLFVTPYVDGNETYQLYTGSIGIKELDEQLKVHLATEKSFDLVTEAGGLRFDGAKGNNYVSKNLLDLSDFSNWYVHNSSTVKRKVLTLKANTNYTISQITDTSGSSQIFIVSGENLQFSAESGNNGALINAPITVKSDSNGKVTVGVRTGYTLGTFMLNEGLTALPYEPYGLFVAGQQGKFAGTWLQNIISSADGVTIQTNAKRIYSDYYVSAKSGDAITITSDRGHASVLRFYDTTKKFKSTESDWVANGTSRTMPIDGYFRINLKKSDDSNITPSEVGNINVSVGGVKYALAIQTNNGKATTSADYKAKEVFIPLSSPLCEGDSITFDKETHAKGYIDLGQYLVEKGFSKIGYENNSNGKYFYITIDDKAVGNFNLLSNKYKTSDVDNVSGMGDFEIKGHYSQKYIFFKDSNHTSVPTSQNNWLVGTTLEYELATPTSTDTTAEQKKAMLSLVSYKGTTKVDSADSQAKAEFSIAYGKSETVATALNGERIAKKNEITLENLIETMYALNLESEV